MDTPPVTRIPKGTRMTHVGLSVLLIGYGAFGVYIDDLFLPRRFGLSLHLHGIAAWTMCGAFVCAGLNLLTLVVDHCDCEEKERPYLLFARITQACGWALFATGLLLGVIFGYHAGRG